MKILVLLFAALLVAGCGEKSSDSVTLPLSDTDVEQLLKVAVERDALEFRDGLYYKTNESEPYNGWTKMMYKKVANPAHSGRKRNLTQMKGGKPVGIATGWFPNGQKVWETTYKDGELVSEKYWNSKGEEVETIEETD